MKKINNHGFTLIELLAVITILGILLLVGIPAISKTIFNSRKDTAETSVKRYVNEINKEIKSHEIDGNEVSDGTYSIMKGGNVCLETYDEESDSCSGQMLEIDMEGSVPESGQVEVFNKRVVDVYNAKVNSFYVNDNSSSFVATSTPAEIAKKICLATDELSYDLGTLYTCEVADGVNYDFRILSISGDTVSLMMTSNLPGVSTAWYNEVNSSGRILNYCGPVQAYQALSNATSGWNRLKNINYQFDSGFHIAFNGNIGSYRIYSDDPKCEKPGVYFNSMKARMASVSETSSCGDWYKDGTKAAWGQSGQGYWLNDPHNTASEPGVFGKTVGGTYNSIDEIGNGSLGIRPVIQVSKGELA